MLSHSVLIVSVSLHKHTSASLLNILCMVLKELARSFVGKYQYAGWFTIVWCELQYLDQH